MDTPEPVAHAYHLRRDMQIIADNIAHTIDDKKLDPNNVLVMFGEHHPNLSHQLAEIWGIERLRQYYPQLTVCEERAPGNVIPFQEEGRSDWLENLHQFTGRRGWPVCYNVMSAYCDTNNITTARIDSPRERYKNSKDAIFTTDLPGRVKRKCRKDPSYAALYDQFPRAFANLRLLPFLKKRKIFFHDNASVIRRDLHMADQLDQLRHENTGPLVSITGREHITRTQSLEGLGKKRPVTPAYFKKSLLAMALENGHDVFIIRFFQEKEDRQKKLERPLEIIKEGLTDDRLSRLHASYDVLTPYATDDSHPFWGKNTAENREAAIAKTRELIALQVD